MKISRVLYVFFALGVLVSSTPAAAQGLKLNDRGYFESRGVDVRIYDNPGGLRLYQKDRMIVTSGGLKSDVSSPTVDSRNPDIAGDKLEIGLFSDGCSYYVKAMPSGLGLLLSVFVPEPLPLEKAGSMSFELNFLPSQYLGKMYDADGAPGVISANTVAGKSFVLAPEDDAARIIIRSESEIVMSGSAEGLKLHSVVPVGEAGEVLQWYIEPSYDSRWSRSAELQYSHIGYVNGQKKTAVIVVDSNGYPEAGMLVYNISEDGYRRQVLQTSVKSWGRIDERSSYVTSDFTMLKETGIYCLEYGGTMSEAFVVAEDAFDGKWRNVLKRMPEALESGNVDLEYVLSRLAGLWENFRPEDDFSGNGVPDVIDMVKFCTGRIVDGEVFSDRLPDEMRFRRVSALAAAGRVLRGFDDALAYKAENFATLLWNIISGHQSAYKYEAAMQVWFTTGNELVKKSFYQPVVNAVVDNEGFAAALELYPMMDAKAQKKMDEIRPLYVSKLKIEAAATPSGLPALEGDALIQWALEYYLMWKTFPDSVDPSVVLNCLSAIYGNHTYADEVLLDSLAPASMPDFVALSMAAQKIASVMAK